jgi:hypothetical protein
MIANDTHRHRVLPGSTATRLRIKRALFTSDEEAAKILNGLKRAEPAWPRAESGLETAPQKKKVKVEAGPSANQGDSRDDVSAGKVDAAEEAEARRIEAAAVPHVHDTGKRAKTEQE